MSDMNPNPVAGAVQAEMGTGLPAAAYASPEHAEKARHAQQAAQTPGLAQSMANGLDIAATSTRRLAKGVGKMAILDDGTEVKVMRCKVNQYHLIAKILSLIFNTLGIQTLAQLDQLKELNPVKIIELLIDVQDPLIEAMEALSDMSAADLEELEIGEFMMLMTDVWEVNRQYFLERILPQIKRMSGSA